MLYTIFSAYIILSRKLISLGYDVDFILLLLFLVFSEPYIEKPLALCHLENVPLTIKYNNTEANFTPSCNSIKNIWQWQMKITYLCLHQS